MTQTAMHGLNAGLMAGGDNGRGRAHRAPQECVLETSSSIRGRPRLDVRWLLLALAWHAPLLFVTIEHGVDDPRTRHAAVLELSFLRPALPPRILAASEPQLAEMPSNRTKAAVPESTAASAPVTLAPTGPDPLGTSSETEAADAPPRHSTATLMHTAREMRLSPGRPQPARQLGLQSPGSSSGAAGADSRFDRAPPGAQRPAMPAIRDRWLASDGSHQVLVALPNGDLVCGRAEGWDPMRPLIEPVMMFRTCGRQPGFTMPADARPAYSMPE